MNRISAALLGLTIGWVRILSAQGTGAITGSVRDTSGAPLAGAEVTLDTTRVTTNQQGAFQFSGIRAGQHLIAIRLIGYLPLRRLVMVQSGTTHHEFVLQSAVPILPTVIVAARRTGIYGTVGDTALKPLAGVTVLIGGNKGGTVTTDSAGRFSLPTAGPGQHVVDISHPGYAEQRLFVEVLKDDGVELGIRLHSSPWRASRVDAVAIQDLGRRLALNLPTDRIGSTDLKRYGSSGLCEVGQIGESIAKLIGRRPSWEADTVLTIVINGTQVLEKMSVRALCSWKASEVQLVEFMPHVCRDVTRTLVYLLDVWCVDFKDNMQRWDPRLNRMIRKRGDPGAVIKGQKPGGPVVVIWEKR